MHKHTIAGAQAPMNALAPTVLLVRLPLAVTAALRHHAMKQAGYALVGPLPKMKNSPAAGGCTCVPNAQSKLQWPARLEALVACMMAWTCCNNCPFRVIQIRCHGRRNLA